MAPKESYRQRQTQELEVIKSIFGNDVEDLHIHGNNAIPSQWKPINIRVELTPLRDSTNVLAKAYVKTKLHVICHSKYPKVAPKIFLEESIGISDQLIDELLRQLQQQSNELRGEVMIYELTQTVQAFLLKHNKPPRGSFYDEMLQRNQQREQELLNLQKQREHKERQNIIDEVERRKEMFISETKRREPRRSMSESTRNASSSENSESTSPYYRGHIYPSNCANHRNSDTLHFPRVGRKIRRGCCIGHSQKGCIAYAGLDINTGQLLYITEWNIKYSQIEQHCSSGSGKCFWLSSEPKCSGHRVDDVIASIEKQVSSLSLLNHKNLIQYECVLCIKHKESLLVYLVQDFVLGTSVFNISSSLGWCMDGVRGVAKGILDALVFLHNKGVSHSHLLDSTVFMDNTGTIRVTDFSIVPNLLELIEDSGQRSTQGDLPALGALVESLMNTPTFELRDFVDKCNSDRTLSASELLEHPFLRSSLFTTEDKGNQHLTLALPYNQYKTSLAVLPLNMKQKSSTSQAVTLFATPSVPSSQSRLRTEFEILMYLGKGAFGDVLKVRNILDNREYAIKRIPLPARSRQLYKKMTREVELLSRLNHENVVRYFNSWIESCSDEDIKEMDKQMSSEWSITHHDSITPTKSPQVDLNSSKRETDSSSLWHNYLPHLADTDSDGIEFVDSNGEVAVYEEDDDDDYNESELSPKPKSPIPLVQIMYIQMEFCEKCTLRTAIDDNLYQNSDRLWRLFREIAEGLSHIHQQGIIHRDLKPVNIFLDSHDQIKIGDFGLATTSFLALQANTEQHHHNNQNSYITLTEDGTGTGKVGTTLYVAPELTGKASKSTYNQKVDMYTLGIILFEMCSPPFGTGMERVETIINLRSPKIIFPERMMNDTKYEKTVKLVRWLLNHDPAQRPTAEELLASDILPPAQLEASELQEMLKNALANPQSKTYKHIVARCLQQENDEILEYTYHTGGSRAIKSWNTPIVLDSLVTLNPIIEFIKSKIILLYRKHGAIEVATPLLSPLSKRISNNWVNHVRLMTHSGCVVVLPSDLRTEFARHIAMSEVNMVRRYCVDRIYREEKVFNFHPKQNYECAFDIISPKSSSHLVDAELLSLAYEIASEIPNSREKNITIRMNHTNLLRAILLYCNVPKDIYSDLFGSILDYIEYKISKFQFYSSVNSIMKKTRTSATTLIDLLLANFQMSGKNSADNSPLKTLIRGKGEAASLAKGALREMESLVSLAQNLGVKYPIHVFAGLPISFERAASGGVVWQMIADLKSNRTSRSSVIAVGERYDSMLMEYQKQAQGFNPNLSNRGIGGAGLSFFLDKLVSTMFSEDSQICHIIDVGVCISGSRPPLKDITYILRLLWSAGIRSSFLETITNSGDEAQDLAKLGANHIILIAENGALRIRSWERERFQERHVTLAELVDFIQKIPRSSEMALSSSSDISFQQSNTSYYSGSYGSSKNDYGQSTSGSSASIKNTYNSSSLSNLPNVRVQFLTHEKMTANYRRRLENQVIQQMTSTLTQFVKNENIVVFVVELAQSTLGAIVGAINPRGIRQKKTDQEISSVIERFPKHRRYITEIYDKIFDYITDAKTTVVALYSIADSYYRIII